MSKAITYRCKGPRLGEYTAKEAAAAGNPNLEGHAKYKGCGADLAPLIAKVKQDGMPHEMQCANCGNKSTIRRTPPSD